MSDFHMPSLGADMEDGTVVEWRVHPGDVVKRGDIVALVETEKGLVEIEIFVNGVVETIVVAEGTKVPVGTVLATVREAGAQVGSIPIAGPLPGAQVVARVTPPVAPATVPQPAPRPAARPVEAAVPPPPVTSRSARPRVSPIARRTAEALGVDLATITGTGEGGAITKVDVERSAGAARARQPTPAGPPTPAATAEERQAAMRRAIAAAMARSKREIPHYYLATHIDMSRPMAWLGEENARRPVTERLLYGALLIRAVGLALRQFPDLNGLFVDGTFHASDAAHVGVAISLRQGGLVAPAIRDVDKRSVDEVSKALLDLVQRARSGVLRSSEVSDATITVTSLGDQGVETVFGVIYPPQVALVGFGKMVERPCASGGMVGVRPVIVATLAADHRVSDGHRGGRFLTAIDRLLQVPEKL